MIFASRARAERKALSNGPIIKPELTMGVMPRAESRSRSALSSSSLSARSHGSYISKSLRAELGRNGDEAFEARAFGIGARSACPLQPEMIGEAIGVEAEGECVSAPLRRKRLHVRVHRSPASTVIDCLVTMRLSSAARNNAMRAMSSPRRAAFIDWR